MSKKEKKAKKKERSAYSEYMDTAPEAAAAQVQPVGEEETVVAAPPVEQVAPAEQVQPEEQVFRSPYDISYERTLLIDEDTDEEPVAQSVINEVSAGPELLEVNTENVIAENLPFSIGVSSVIGKRKSQQDSVFVPDVSKTMREGKPRFLCIVSDGMGGLASGDVASKTAVASLSAAYYSEMWNSDKKVDRVYFVEKANEINEAILDISDAAGNHAKTGATLIAVEVNGDEFNFVNVGDSRIYFFRGGKSFQLTHDQNYLSRLMGMVAAGEITEQEALSHPKKEALISFCGIDELKLVETNVKPIELMDEDIIVLCSDGLYRLLNEQEILEIIESAENDMSMAAYRLTQAANNKNYRGQDNTSVVVIKIIHTNNKEENEL